MANVSSSNGLEKYPKLRFKGFLEPWETVCLSDIATYQKERTEVTKTNYVSTENMLQNFLGLEPYLDESMIEGILFRKSDTLLANIRPYLRKTWFATENGACSTDVLAIHPTNVDPKFLYNVIAQNSFIDYVMSGAKGSKMPRGDKAHIMEYEIAIPNNVYEQNKIADFLQLISDRIEKIQQLIEHLKKYKRGVSDQLFEQVKGISTQLAFSSVFVLLQNNTFSRDLLTTEKTEIQNIHYGDVLIKYGSSVNADSDEIPYIKNDAEIGRFEHNSYLVSGDIVLADTAEDYTVGKATEIINLTNKKILSGLHTIPCRPIMSFAPMFLGYYLNSSSFRKQLIPLIQGTKVSSIGKAQLMKTTLHIPPLDDQKRIANLLHTLDIKINLLTATVEQMKLLKSAMIQQLFI